MEEVDHHTERLFQDTVAVAVLEPVNIHRKFADNILEDSVVVEEGVEEEIGYSYMAALE